MFVRVAIVIGLGLWAVIPLGCRFDRAGVEFAPDAADDNTNDNANANTNTNANNNTNDNTNTNNNNNPNQEICDNQVDDDADSLTDCSDPDCAAEPECQTEICDIAGDEDNNGLADCDDPVCLNTATCGDCKNNLLEPDDAADMLTWQGHGGFSIDASVRIRSHPRPRPSRT